MGVLNTQDNVKRAELLNPVLVDEEHQDTVEM
jgi:hypothetical protein